MIDRSNIDDIEYGIIGGLLLWPKYAGVAVAKLPADAFMNEGTRTVYEAISHLHFAGKPIDCVTVQRETGPDYVPVINEALPRATAEVEYYCDLLLEYDRLWHIHLLAGTLQSAANMTEAEKTLEQINALMCSRNEVETVDAMELVKAYILRKNEKSPPPEYISFGMEALDKALFVRPGDVVIIGGYSSAGKTLLSLQFALHMAKKYRVGYFSLETDTEKMGERMISHYAQIDFRRIKTGMEDSRDLERVLKMGMELGDYSGHLKFHRASGLSVRDIQAITLSLRHEIIFVDYLQIVDAPGRDFREKVTNVSMSLHTLAQSHNVTVIALAQLSRPERTKAGTAPPNMWSFKESGQIENDADVAMLLYPSDMNDNASPRYLKVSKNKDGTKTQIVLEFDGVHQTLKPMPPSMAEKYRNVMKASRNAVRQRNSADGSGQVTLVELEGEDDDIPF